MEFDNYIKNLLSKRQLQIAKYVVTGMSNLKIAQKLEISENTIKANLKTMFIKINVPNKATLAGVLMNHINNN